MQWGSNLFNTYGSPISKNFSEFSILCPLVIFVCIISLPVCHNMEVHQYFCLPFLLPPHTFFELSTSSCFYDCFSLLPFLFPPWLPTELDHFSFSCCYASENSVIDLKLSIISKSHSFYAAMRKKFSVRYRLTSACDQRQLLNWFF